MFNATSKGLIQQVLVEFNFMFNTTSIGWIRLIQQVYL